MTATPAVEHDAALLERAVGYTRGCLALVRPGLLSRPTPCSAWDLAALLAHMDDSLAAFTEAAFGSVDVLPPVEAAGTDPVARLRARACALLAAWAPVPRPPQVRVAGHALPRDVLAAAGALEIAVHGWDVATACGEDRPLPPALALDLLDVLATWPVLVQDTDRPARFGPPAAVRRSASPSTRLLAVLGRVSPGSVERSGHTR